MPRKKRDWYLGATHHVMCRGIRRIAIFRGFFGNGSNALTSELQYNKAFQNIVIFSGMEVWRNRLKEI